MSARGRPDEVEDRDPCVDRQAQPRCSLRDQYRQPYFPSHLHPELEVLVRILAMGVDGELRHGAPPERKPTLGVLPRSGLSVVMIRTHGVRAGVLSESPQPFDEQEECPASS